MDRDEFHYDFLLLRDQTEAYDTEISDFGCDKICIDTGDVPMQPRKIRTYVEIYRAFKKKKYDIVHFQSVSPSVSSSIIIFLAVLAGIRRRILHSHLAYDWRQYGTKRMIKYKIARKLNSFFCNEFLACSELAAEYSFSSDIVRRKKYIIVNNAIDAYGFKFTEESRKRGRDRYGLGNRFVIGNVGRFVEQKNHMFMIDVLRKALEIEPNCCMLLVGGTVESEPNQRKRIEKYAKEKGVYDSIIFAGEQKNIVDCLAAMDSFIFPSYFEGLGIVGVEAQASGLTVVAAKNYIPHELKITSNLVWLDLNDTLIDWANALRNVPEIDRQNAYKMVDDSDFNILKTAEQLENIYRGKKAR